jgi:hypothetical protein
VAADATTTLQHVAKLVLVTHREIAELLDVSSRTAQRYIRRPDFPAPEADLAIGGVWSRTKVLDWAKKTLPLAEGAPAHKPKR